MFRRKGEKRKKRLTKSLKDSVFRMTFRLAEDMGIPCGEPAAQNWICLFWEYRGTGQRSETVCGRRPMRERDRDRLRTAKRAGDRYSGTEGSMLRAARVRYAFFSVDCP